MATERVVKTRFVGLMMLLVMAVGLVLTARLYTTPPRSLSQLVHDTRITPAYIPTGFYESALQSSSVASAESASDIRGLIVNHHLLAVNFIVHALRSVQPATVDRILILAPNHFSAGKGYFQTTRSSFSTPFGMVNSDQAWLQPLLRDHYLIANDQPFQGEHGIYGILPLLIRIYPGVPIVPIITKVNTPLADVATLAAALKPYLDDRTLIIASLDFAHDATNAEAAARDDVSIQVLQSLTVDTSFMNHEGDIAVDSPPTLSLFLRLMTQQGARNFTLLDHSNSALETGQLEATNVTSHITGLYRRSQSAPPVVH